uniref:AAA+ ATPase domain-containing protein n=1 Tax=Chromera velia CCMP2878 TaxID=1169474 RepID=A0A0G4FH96_9ALVE|eukprot:Cvel_17014.t1-p1 / transcript=Cvel_17014.t1 / gene=Cvel_17014 / organism=Chromera_velia_CCMP2878 / gene_product=Replication factor C subunit 5, putative / transcript_product=Replication factor C subunit 5, putative / location=Cvel_scaffold1338:528-1658(+) / protein_length=377 / sequence_SO=supercontig / SO=protein_coding / is_pseudo=false
MSENGDVEMHDASAPRAEAAAAAAAANPKGTVIGGQSVLPWVEKYRPQKLDDLIAHHDIIATIQRFINQNKLPHTLFHGPPGTGKTSTILACAKGMYGPKFGSMVLELNASDARGIDVVREQIRTFVQARQLFSTGIKLVVLDEADSMTSAAQFALRRIMEQYSSNARFCIICNYVNKIIPALQSRCTKFRFGPLGDSDVRGRAKEIAASEQLSLTDDGLEALVTLGRGDMRRVLNIMQSCSMAFDEVSAESVYMTTGTPLPSDIDEAFSVLITDGVEEAFLKMDALRISKGYAVVDLITGLFARAKVVKWPTAALSMLMGRLADAEYRLSLGCSEKVQLGAVVGGFAEARAVLERGKGAQAAAAAAASGQQQQAQG